MFFVITHVALNLVSMYFMGYEAFLFFYLFFVFVLFLQYYAVPLMNTAKHDSIPK